MRKIILVHIFILLTLLLCAISPWLLMLLLEAGGASTAQNLQDFGMGIGILGMLITPFGLLAAGVYIVTAILFHFAFTAWRKSTARPATQGYLLTWLALAGAGSLLCLAAFSIYSTANNIAAQARITPSVLDDCAELFSAPLASSWQNGPIAISAFNFNPEDGGSMHTLLILNPDGSLLRRLPMRIRVHSLAWSPDGAQIVFSNQTNLYRIDPLGGEPRPITSENPLENNASLITSPAWSPDGERIYFEKRLPGEEAVNLEIFSIRPDGSDLRQLTSTPGYNISPQPSPDGAHIAFVSSRDGGSAIYLMDSDGSNPRRLLDNQKSASETAFYNDTAPFWSPDGQWLVFASDRDGPYQLNLLHIPTVTTCQLTAGESQPGAPVWSPDGKFILYLNLSSNSLALLRPGDGNLQPLQLSTFASQAGSLSSPPAWRPLP